MMDVRSYRSTSVWWSTDVSRTRRRRTCRTTVCQSLKLPDVSICDLPLVVSFYWSHDIVSEHSAVGLLLWLARHSGTHWQMNCELTLVIGLNQLWRLSSLPLTSVFSALEAFAMMRYDWHWHWHWHQHQHQRRSLHTVQKTSNLTIIFNRQRVADRNSSQQCWKCKS